MNNKLLDSRLFFAGKTFAKGFFIDRFGNVKRRLNVRMRGIQKEDKFLLEEDFIYDDGITEHRSWELDIKPSGDFSAE